MEVGLGIAAGAGWGIAGGLAIALWVALGWRKAPLPPGDSARGDVREFPSFGERRA